MLLYRTIGQMQRYFESGFRRGPPSDSVDDVVQGFGIAWFVRCCASESGRGKSVVATFVSGDPFGDIQRIAQADSMTEVTCPSAQLTNLVRFGQHFVE